MSHDTVYISRQLRRIPESDRPIEESELLALGRFVVVLGEPGAGKSRMAETLANIPGTVRSSAAKLCRESRPEKLCDSGRILIDGFDQLLVRSQANALDQVLGKLNAAGCPAVILFCRSADWLSASNSKAIVEEYGEEPVLTGIMPLDEDRIDRLLSNFGNMDEFKRLIVRHGLRGLLGNPQTLKMLAEVWRADGRLPESKEKLFFRAAQLLAAEKNEGHEHALHAKLPTDMLLHEAGRICAHLLLSGMEGVCTNVQHAHKDLVPLHQFAINDGALAPAVMRTRLFTPLMEDQFIPVHRTIAEYLAGRWIAQIQDLSESRLFGLLHANGGVPSAIRGLHAWLGCFSPKFARRCIDADPFGILRFGDISDMPIQSTRYLLSALKQQAERDPYFRNEDWGVRRVSGLTNPALKGDIIPLISGADRIPQLSSLLIESIAGVLLDAELQDVLISIMKNVTLKLIEREAAVQALHAQSGLAIERWHEVIAYLTEQEDFESYRVAIEILEHVGSDHFPFDMIGEVLLALHGVDSNIIGVDYMMIHQMSGQVASGVLDFLVSKGLNDPEEVSFESRRNMDFAFRRMILRAVEDKVATPDKLWGWISATLDKYRVQRSGAVEAVALACNDVAFRKTLQWHALLSGTAVSLDELSRVLPNLMPSVDEACHLLAELSSGQQITEKQEEVWQSIVHCHRFESDEAIMREADCGARRHPRLEAIRTVTSGPPLSDGPANRPMLDSESRGQFAGRKRAYESNLEDIAVGGRVDDLALLARAYLGHRPELAKDSDPVGRLIDWVGVDAARAALAGFESTIRSWRRCLKDAVNDLLDRQSSATHWVVAAGVAECIRTGDSLESLCSMAEIHSALAIQLFWSPCWDRALSELIDSQLKSIVMQDSAGAEGFFSILIETQLERRRSDVVGLDLLVSDSRCSAFAAKLAKDWLTRFATAPRDVQKPLISLLRAQKDSGAFVQIMETRVGAPNGLPSGVLEFWLANAYCFQPSLLKGIDRGPDFIWEIIECINRDIENLPAERCAAIIEHFGHAWPPVERPKTMIGNKRPWDASHFMLTCIRRMANDPSATTTQLLEDLREKLKSTQYLAPLSNAAEAQKRLWRDAEYRTSDFAVVQSVLANDLPLTISDLRLRLVDLLCEIQRHVIDSDSNGWEAFWMNEEPRIENYCRDRLIEWLRQRANHIGEFFPELPTPNQNRVDIYVSLRSKGLPIEIKGQWHENLWNAASTQLDEQYCIDPRTDRQGIYLVLWFGQTASKKPRIAPPGIKTPTNAEELRTALIERLPIDTRERISVFVLDVSKPPSQLNTKGKKKPKSKNNLPEAS
ncbi:MAG: hypothetical protein MUE46_15705 [Xanthomonadales bacterium]|jgi:hypothetical protein|nr:hypothetical protein [Xanthomonadales bacterium]